MGRSTSFEIPGFVILRTDARWAIRETRAIPSTYILEIRGTPMARLISFCLHRNCLPDFALASFSNDYFSAFHISSLSSLTTMESRGEDTAKRPKNQVSIARRACDPCRARKVACDRGSPCANCITARVSCTHSAIASNTTPLKQRVLISAQ